MSSRVQARIAASNACVFASVEARQVGGGEMNAEGLKAESFALFDFSV
jgi:hypothetical protein